MMIIIVIFASFPHQTRNVPLFVKIGVKIYLWARLINNRFSVQGFVQFVPHIQLQCLFDDVSRVKHWSTGSTLVDTGLLGAPKWRSIFRLVWFARHRPAMWLSCSNWSALLQHPAEVRVTRSGWSTLQSWIHDASIARVSNPSHPRSLRSCSRGPWADSLASLPFRLVHCRQWRVDAPTR